MRILGDTKMCMLRQFFPDVSDCICTVALQTAVLLNVFEYRSSKHPQTSKSSIIEVKDEIFEAVMERYPPLRTTGAETTTTTTTAAEDESTAVDDGNGEDDEDMGLTIEDQQQVDVRQIHHPIFAIQTARQEDL